jgi:hypothetical protein
MELKRINEILSNLDNIKSVNPLIVLFNVCNVDIGRN